MKQWFVMIGLIIQSSTALSALQAEELSICWEKELKPPCLTLNKEGQVSGSMVKTLEAILDKANIQYKHILMPWVRCLQATEEGKIDILPNASLKAERTHYAYYSDAAYTSELAVYFLKKKYEHLNIRNATDLSQYTVGGMKGFNYSFYGRGVKVEPRARTREQLIELLKLERIDLAIMQKRVLNQMVNAGLVNIADIDHIPDPIRPTKSYHIMVSHKTSDALKIIKLINQGLEDKRLNLTAQVKH